jgi:hypothetical protein
MTFVTMPPMTRHSEVNVLASLLRGVAFVRRAWMGLLGAETPRPLGSGVRSNTIG